MLFTAVKHGQFLKFCNFEARYLKNGRSHKKIYFYSKSSKSGQKCIGTKKITIFFYYPSQNFALWQKIAMTQNFYPNFFYSLDPPLSEFKVKFRGHPFAYTLTNTATGLWYNCAMHSRLASDADGKFGSETASDSDDH